MPVRDHNPTRRRLHLPIVSTDGVPASGERKPPWLKVRLQRGPNFRELEGIMRGRSLHTVCEEAMCPNISECWEEREATFLILVQKAHRLRGGDRLGGWLHGVAHRVAARLRARNARRLSVESKTLADADSVALCLALAPATAVEPLPTESPLWSLPNVIITPHGPSARLTR